MPLDGRRSGLALQRVSQTGPDFNGPEAAECRVRQGSPRRASIYRHSSR